jgi:uncharacterized membrane protein
MIIYAAVVSISGAIDKYVLNFMQPGLYQVIGYILPALLTVLFIPGTIANIKPILKPSKSRLNSILSSFLLAAATFSYFYSYRSGGEISKVGPISQSSVILTVVLGIIFLKEKQNLKNKLIGAMIVCIGVVLMKI